LDTASYIVQYSFLSCINANSSSTIYEIDANHSTKTLNES